MGIPKEIIDLVAEATSKHNDGYVAQECRERLVEIRDYITNALGEGDERNTHEHTGTSEAD